MSEKKQRGRPPVSDIEKSADFTCKLPLSLTEKLQVIADRLTADGEKADKSKVARALLEYRIDNGYLVAKEVFRQNAAVKGAEFLR